MMSTGPVNILTPEVVKFLQHSGCRNITILFSNEKHVGGRSNPNDRNLSDKMYWESKDFVKLPYNIENTFLKSGDHRWNTIEKNLNNLILEPMNYPLSKICTCIYDYSNADASKCDFASLTKLGRWGTFQNSRIWFEIAKSALKLPNLLCQQIPILKQGENGIILMTQQQALSIMANAFFCTYPKYATNSNCKLGHMNFFNLFQGNPHISRGNDCKFQKLLCIINYFNLALQNLKSGGNVSYISYERRVVNNNEIPKWKEINRTMADIKVCASGTIEDDGSNMLQVIFSNKSIGGGILGNGAIMEEIRFATCPELIVSRLFTEQLTDNEVLVITGAQKYSCYKGYGNNFEFNGPHDSIPDRDEFGRAKIEVVAMDALKFSEKEKDDQYKMHNINRELKKCFCAFKTRNPDDFQKSIASGNWGCGSFNGDAQLKLVIQWLAASYYRRKLVFFTCGGNETKDAEKVIKQLKEKQATIGQLYKVLELYSDHVETSKINTKFSQNARRALPLFEYIIQPKIWNKL